jgi:hypothetical protein
LAAQHDLCAPAFELAHHGRGKVDAVRLVVVQHRHVARLQVFDQEARVDFGLYIVAGVDAEELPVAVLRGGQGLQARSWRDDDQVQRVVDRQRGFGLAAVEVADYADRRFAAAHARRDFLGVGGGQV